MGCEKAVNTAPPGAGWLAACPRSRRNIAMYDAACNANVGQGSSRSAGSVPYRPVRTPLARASRSFGRLPAAGGETRNVDVSIHAERARRDLRAAGGQRRVAVTGAREDAGRFRRPGDGSPGRYLPIGALERQGFTPDPPGFPEAVEALRDPLEADDHGRIFAPARGRRCRSARARVLSHPPCAKFVRRIEGHLPITLSS